LPRIYEEDGIYYITRLLSEPERASLENKIRERTELIGGACSARDIEEARLIMSAALATRPMTADEVRAEGAAWGIALTDEDMSGNVSKGVLGLAVREFLGGRHGEFFPNIAKFMVVCRNIRDVARAEVKLLERYLGLGVKEEATQRIDRERIASFLASIGIKT